MKLLNVGGGSKEIPIPEHYKDWEHHMLDINPDSGADIFCDARELKGLMGHQYDAVYCSHNLEHYYRHDLPKVLAGFHHVTTAHGFVEVHVPDFVEAVRPLVEGRGDINQSLYKSPAGYVTVCDVIYGHDLSIRKHGDFMSHKNAFTERSLVTCLTTAGFRFVYVGHEKESFSMFAFAFKKRPSPEVLKSIGMEGT